jgi:hypothetical protein
VVGTVPANVRSFQDPAAFDPGDYCWQVQPMNGLAAGPVSAEGCATVAVQPPDPPPNAPTPITITITVSPPAPAAAPGTTGPKPPPYTVFGYNPVHDVIVGWTGCNGWDCADIRGQTWLLNRATLVWSMAERASTGDPVPPRAPYQTHVMLWDTVRQQMILRTGLGGMSNQGPTWRYTMGAAPPPPPTAPSEVRGSTDPAPAAPGWGPHPSDQAVGVGAADRTHQPDPCGRSDTVFQRGVGDQGYRAHIR